MSKIVSSQPKENILYPSLLGEIKSSPSESPLMEKKNSLKEDHEETKLSLSDIETRNPVSEVGSATVPLRAVVEERTVSFKLGDLEEAPERERLPSVDLKEETSIDGSMNGAWTLLGGDRRVSRCFLYHCGAHCLDLMLLALSVRAFWSWQVLCSCQMGTSFSSVKLSVTRLTPAAITSITPCTKTPACTKSSSISYISPRWETAWETLVTSP